MTKYEAYLLTDKWKKLSFSIKKRDGFKCTICGSKNKLQVHHKHYKNIFHEKPEDLITVCNICHKFKCHSDKTVFKYINRLEKIIYLLLIVSLMMEKMR